VKTQASSIPETIDIQEYFGKLVAYLRRNITETAVIHEDETVIEYAYDEVCTELEDDTEDFYLPADKSDPEESYDEVYITDYLEDWVAENFDELFELLEADEHEKTVTDVKTYINRQWLKREEVNPGYVNSGVLTPEDVEDI